jgi:cytochrome c-type biogenesis protein CcmH/NrfG
MSLLMDALKKAELAKRQNRDATDESPRVEPSGSLALEPFPEITMSAIEPEPRTAAQTPALASGKSAADPADFPTLPAHLEALDAQFLAETQAAAAKTRITSTPLESPREPSHELPRELPREPVRKLAEPNPVVETMSPAQKAGNSKADHAGKAAAQNVFTAKQAEKPTSRKTFGIVIGVLTLLAGAGIGGYFWWQLQPKSAPITLRMPTGGAVAPTPLSTAAPPAQTVAQTAAPATPVLAAPVATVAAKQEQEVDDETPVPAAKPTRRSPVARPAPEAEPEGPVRVTRAPLKLNPGLARGFDAFNRGDYPGAQTEYENVLKAEPRNTDALHGLAAISVRQGKGEQADWYYQRLLEADPHDAIALANLINGRGQVDQSVAESRLKTLIAEQPGIAAPLFSLGNLYARQMRWNEAQQAYFRAYGADPENPDILYNLAISLEHLRQNKLAAQYYALAVSAARNRAGAFDPALASARLRALQP